MQRRTVFLDAVVECHSKLVDFRTGLESLIASAVDRGFLAFAPSHQRASTHVMPPASAGAENEDARLLGAHCVRGGYSAGGEFTILGSAHFVSGH